MADVAVTFRVTAVIQHESLDDVMRALRNVEKMPGGAISSHETVSQGQGPELPTMLGDHKWARLDIIVSPELLDTVVETIEAFAQTGRRGNRSIVIIPVRRAMH